MNTLHIDVSPDGEAWASLPSLRPGDPYGSVSDNLDDGTRHIYMFGVNEVDDVAEVNRSIMGFDTASSEWRDVTSVGLERVARLEPGQQHELTVKTDRSAAAVTIRFTFGEL